MDMDWLHQVITLCPDELVNSKTKHIYEEYATSYTQANIDFWKTLKNNVSEDVLNQIISSLYKGVRDTIASEINSEEGCGHTPDEYYMLKDDPLYWIRQIYDDRIEEIMRNFWIRCNNELSERRKNRFLTRFMERKNLY